MIQNEHFRINSRGSDGELPLKIKIPRRPSKFYRPKCLCVSAANVKSKNLGNRHAANFTLNDENAATFSPRRFSCVSACKEFASKKALERLSIGLCILNQYIQPQPHTKSDKRDKTATIVISHFPATKLG